MLTKNFTLFFKIDFYRISIGFIDENHGLGIAKQVVFEGVAVGDPDSHHTIFNDPVGFLKARSEFAIGVEFYFSIFEHPTFPGVPIMGVLPSADKVLSRGLVGESFLEQENPLSVDGSFIGFMIGCIDVGGEVDLECPAAFLVVFGSNLEVIDISPRFMSEEKARDTLVQVFRD